MTTKKQLTPEQSRHVERNRQWSIQLHRHPLHRRQPVSKGIHKVADATQRTTDVTARVAGTAQVCAIPAAKQAWTGFTGLFAKKTAATPASL